MAKYDDGTRYLVSGATLNALERELATCRLLAGEGLEMRRIPGTGTELRLADPTGPGRQWTLRTEGDEARMYAGTLTGLGLSGYLPGHDPDTWVEVGADRSIWLKITLEVAGLPVTYYTGPESSETLWLPHYVSEAAAEIVELALGESGPSPTRPTVDPDTGESAAAGIYWFRIGSTSTATGARNDYTGPLGIGYCPPDGAHLTTLT